MSQNILIQAFLALNDEYCTNIIKMHLLRLIYKQLSNKLSIMRPTANWARYRNLFVIGCALEDQFNTRLHACGSRLACGYT